MKAAFLFQAGEQMFTLFDLPLILTPAAGCVTGFLYAQHMGLSNGLVVISGLAGFVNGVATVLGINNAMIRLLHKHDNSVIAVHVMMCTLWIFSPFLSWYLAAFIVALLQRVMG